MKSVNPDSLMGGFEYDNENNFKKHRQRVERTSKKIDNNPPKEYKNANSSKRNHFQRVRDKDIMKKNVALTKNLLKIIDGRSKNIVTSNKFVESHPGTLNYRRRLKKAQEINADNQKIANKIESVKSYYHRKEFLTPVMPRISKMGALSRRLQVHSARSAPGSNTNPTSPRSVSGPRSGRVAASVPVTSRSEGAGRSIRRRHVKYKSSSAGKEKKFKYHIRDNGDYKKIIKVFNYTMVLEYTKLQRGRVLDVVILRTLGANNTPQFIIFGVDTETGQLYELLLEKGDIISILSARGRTGSKESASTAGGSSSLPSPSAILSEEERAQLLQSFESIESLLYVLNQVMLSRVSDFSASSRKAQVRQISSRNASMHRHRRLSVGNGSASADDGTTPGGAVPAGLLHHHLSPAIHVPSILSTSGKVILDEEVEFLSRQNKMYQQLYKSTTSNNQADQFSFNGNYYYDILKDDNMIEGEDLIDSFDEMKVREDNRRLSEGQQHQHQFGSNSSDSTGNGDDRVAGDGSSGSSGDSGQWDSLSGSIVPDAVAMRSQHQPALPPSNVASTNPSTTHGHATPLLKPMTPSTLKGRGRIVLSDVERKMDQQNRKLQSLRTSSRPTSSAQQGPNVAAVAGATATSLTLRGDHSDSAVVEVVADNRPSETGGIDLDSASKPGAPSDDIHQSVDDSEVLSATERREASLFTERELNARKVDWVIHQIEHRTLMEEKAQSQSLQEAPTPTIQPHPPAADRPRPSGGRSDRTGRKVNLLPRTSDSLSKNDRASGANDASALTVDSSPTTVTSDSPIRQSNLLADVDALGTPAADENLRRVGVGSAHNLASEGQDEPSSEGGTKTPTMPSTDRPSSRRSVGRTHRLVRSSADSEDSTRSVDKSDFVPSPKFAVDENDPFPSSKADPLPTNASHGEEESGTYDDDFGSYSRSQDN